MRFLALVLAVTTAPAVGDEAPPVRSTDDAAGRQVLQSLRDLQGQVERQLAAQRQQLWSAQSPEALVSIGRYMIGTGNYLGARATLLEAVLRAPENGEAQYYLGLTDETLADLTAARGQYERAVELMPNDARGYIGLGSVLLKQDRIEESEAHLSRALALDPQNVETLALLGRVAMIQRRPEQAVSFFERAVALNGGHVDARYQLARLYFQVGRRADGERALQEVKRLLAERSEALAAAAYMRPPGIADQE